MGRDDKVCRCYRLAGVFKYYMDLVKILKYLCEIVVYVEVEEN